MFIATYEQWKADSFEYLKEVNAEVDCTSCEGYGVINDFCECCGQYTETECSECDGHGVILFSEADRRKVERIELNQRNYFRAVVSDLKQWCAFTRQDFLEVAGHFVNEYREGRYA